MTPESSLKGVARRRIALWNGKPNAARVEGSDDPTAKPREAPVVGAAHSDLPPPMGLPRHFVEAYREVATGHIGMCRCGWDSTPSPDRATAELLLAEHVASPIEPEPIAVRGDHLVRLAPRVGTSGERFVCQCSCGWMAHRTTGSREQAASLARTHLVEIERATT